MKKNFPSIKALLIITILLSTNFFCSKRANFETKTTLGREFFKSENTILSEVQRAVTRFDKNEVITHIDKIEYTDDARKSFALVYYQSNKGISNIAFEKKYISNSLVALEGNEMTIECSGNCGGPRCQVRIVPSGEGISYVECTCSGCAMHIIKDIE